MNTIKIEQEGPIYKIILNRPKKKNAFNAELILELTEAFDVASKSDDIRVVILKSNGTVFSAGADLAYLQSLQNFSFEENLDDSNKLKDLLFKIYSNNKITIAQVEGHAIAGGCGLVTVCDFAYSVPEAQFGYTEVKIGFVPALVMYFLINKIGEGKTRALLLTGKLITADIAQKYGLINEVFNKESIEKNIKEIALKLAHTTSFQSIVRTKKMLAEIRNYSLQDALDYASKNNAEARLQEDCKKGIAAFLEKKELKWTN